MIVKERKEQRYSLLQCTDYQYNQNFNQFTENREKDTLVQIVDSLVWVECVQKWSAQVFKYCPSIKLSKSQQAQKTKQCCCLLSCYYLFLLPSALVPVLQKLMTLISQATSEAKTMSTANMPLICLSFTWLHMIVHAFLKQTNRSLWLAWIRN